MIPSPQLLHALDQTRLPLRHAEASVGLGERRSRAKGSGMEFADFREYVQGDDTRHLDARLHARLGSFHVRQYEVLRQLPVTLVIDASRSMAAVPAKLAVAKLLASSLGYAGLAGGDRVRATVWNGDRLDVSTTVNGTSRARGLFEWIEEKQPVGYGRLEDAASQITEQVNAGGLAIIISDWWVEEPRRLLHAAAVRGAEVWAIQVLSRPELEPTTQPRGRSQLVDSETGEILEMSLDPGTLADYARALADWQDGLKGAVQDVAGRHLLIPTDDPLEQTVRTLRLTGMIG